MTDSEDINDIKNRLHGIEKRLKDLEEPEEEEYDDEDKWVGDNDYDDDDDYDVDDEPPCEACGRRQMPTHQL